MITTSNATVGSARRNVAGGTSGDKEEKGSVGANRAGPQSGEDDAKATSACASRCMLPRCRTVDARLPHPDKRAYPANAIRHPALLNSPFPQASETLAKSRVYPACCRVAISRIQGSRWGGEGARRQGAEHVCDIGTVLQQTKRI